MSKYNLEEAGKAKKPWNGHAQRYDEWYQTFEGAVETYVDWELLKNYLPKNKTAKILDAAGGTGRISLPLTKMGYSLTLCDVSLEMLDLAKQKFLREGVYKKVKLLECDIRKLSFADDESFDFVLCWNGAIEAVKELIRVTKKGGRISLFLINKWAFIINEFFKDPDSTLAIRTSTPCYVKHHGCNSQAITPNEARTLFEPEGIRVLEIFGVCGWLDVLRIPEKVLKSHTWDKNFFNQTTELVLNLSKEPSIKGMSKHLVLYGEKI